MDATDKGHTGLADYYTEKGETPGRVGRVRHGTASTAWTPATSSPPTRCRTCSAPACTRWPSAQRAAAIAGPDRPAPRPAQGRAARHAVQGLRERRQPVPGRGRHSASRPSTRPPDCRATGRSRPQERARIRTEVATRLLPRRARPGPGGCARAGRATIAKHFAAQDERCGRLRPDVLAGQVRLGAVGGGRAQDRRGDRAGPPRGGQGRAAASSSSRRCSPATAPTGSGRSTSAAWWPRRSPTATPAPATPTCTPTSRSRTRSRPLDGQWLAIDGRVLYKAKVSASETYNTALERHLGDALGVRFAERPEPGARKRPVREIVGVDPRPERALLHAAAQRRGPPQGAGRPSSSRATAARRPRSSRCSWPSRPPWRPARPSTNRARRPTKRAAGRPRRRRARAAAQRSQA